MTINRNLSILAGGVSSTGVLGVPNGGSGATTLTGYLIGNGTSAFTASSTIPTTALSGTVTNAQLTNSAITINGTSTSLGGSISVGTVTSVAASVPAFLSITGSPITSSGTLAITLSGTALPTTSGGTGLSSLTAGYIPYGNGTGAFNSSSGLTFDGTNFATLGYASATSFRPTSSTIPTNGMYLPNTNTLGLATNTTERMRIFSSGGVSIGNTTDPGATNLSVTGTGKYGTTVSVGAATPASTGAGISFPATQSASTDANTLDDYEEGTWTPVVTASAGSITSYTASGAYTKVGNLVTLSVDITITNNGTGSGTIYATLPFTCASTSTYMYGVGQEIAQTGVRLYLSAVSANNTVIYIQTITSTYPALTGARLTGSLTYRSV